MNSELRFIAACAALICPHVLSAGSVVFPVIRLGEPPTAEATDSALPPITFSIPKFTLSEADRQTVAACLVLEAASQGDFGMRGVMAVIRNRARGQPELFVPTIMRAKQFSALNKLTAGRESLATLVGRARRDCMWTTALAIVDDATTEQWHDPTGGATHYTRSVENTPWTRHLAKTVTIGAHSFYR